MTARAVLYRGDVTQCVGCPFQWDRGRCFSGKPDINIEAITLRPPPRRGLSTCGHEADWSEAELSAVASGLVPWVIRGP